MNAAAGIVEVRVPDMGNFKDVAIIDVLVKPGEKIEPEASLVTLETEKATMDVPSTVGGIVDKVHVSKGGTVSPGDLIVTVRSEGSGDAAAKGDAGAGTGKSGAGGSAGQSAGASGSGGGSSGGVKAADTASAASPASTSSKPSAQSAAPEKAASAPKQAASQAAKSEPAAQGAGTAARDTAADQASAGAPSPAIAGGNGLPPINEPGFSRAHAGPSVRKFARELGVDLTQVKGGGFKGRVTHEDVKAFVKNFLAKGAPAKGGVSAPGGGALPSVPAVDFSQFGEIETKPLSRIQKISGPRLHASWVNIPHVTQFDEADITELEDLRGKLKQKAQDAGLKLTPLAFIIRACVRALQEFPLFNSSLDSTGTSLVLKKYINVGFAADTPNGLVVPVVKDANRKDIYEIARVLGDLSEKARNGKLPAADMQGGTFTISSLGGIGGTAFTPIINAPEVAILGVSRSAMKPVFSEGTFVPRLILPLSLSYDHRVIDGASAARFTTFLAQTLADARGLAEAVP
jgi:pyruvate dehydrogenase E2 component (dihydrolipoyllysine-residue acetyltransferase)